MDTFEKVMYSVLASLFVILIAVFLYLLIVRVNMDVTTPQDASAITAQGCIAVASIGTDRVGQILTVSDPNPNKLSDCLKSSGWAYTDSTRR